MGPRSVERSPLSGFRPQARHVRATVTCFTEVRTRAYCRSRRRSSSVPSTSGEHNAAYHSRIRGSSVGSHADRPYIRGRSESAAVITDVQPMIVQGPLSGPRWPRFPDLDELGRGEPKISRRASHQPTFHLILWPVLVVFFQGMSSLLRSGVPHVPRRGGIFLPQDNADDIRRENAIARDALAEDPLGTRGVIEDGFKFCACCAAHQPARAPTRACSTGRSFLSSRAPCIQARSSS